MSATVLPELASESVDLAERLVRLSADTNLETAEADYILSCGLAAVQRAPSLWPIIRGRIAAGTTAGDARALLVRLRDVVDRNLVLVGILKRFSQAVGETAVELDAAEDRLLQVRAEGTRLSRAIDVPTRWPAASLLSEAATAMQQGDFLTADEFRRRQLDG